jgi:hypothetical protein
VFLSPTELAVLGEYKLEFYPCCRNPLTLPPRALKSKAVHPYDDIIQQNRYRILEFTSIFFAGPISFNRLVLSTGTASKVSVLSAPALCLEVLKGCIYSRRTQTYVHYCIDQDIDTVLFCHRYRSDELIFRTPSCVGRPFLMKFTQVPL